MNTLSKLLASLSALIASLALLWIAQSTHEFTEATLAISGITPRNEDSPRPSIRIDLDHAGSIQLEHEGKLDLTHDGRLDLTHDGAVTVSHE